MCDLQGGCAPLLRSADYRRPPSSMNHKFKTILSFVLFSSVASFADLYEFPCLGDPVLVVGFPASRRHLNNGFVNKRHRKN